MSESVHPGSGAAPSSNPGGDSGSRANPPDDREERRMRRYYRIAFVGFLIICGFYLISGTLGVALAGVEMAGPPPEAEIPVVPAFARLLGSLVVIGLGVPGIFAFLRRREERVLRYLKIGGIAVLILHTLLATFSLEAPRAITIFLLLMAILGMWITLVAFHPRTPTLILNAGAD